MRPAYVIITFPVRHQIDDVTVVEAGVLDVLRVDEQLPGGRPRYRDTDR
jgi:hypothetical protein